MKHYYRISLVVALLVFVIDYVINYKRLLALQPIWINGNLVGPDNLTSFPPSSAWIIAFPWAIASFVVCAVLIRIYIAFEK